MNTMDRVIDAAMAEVIEEEAARRVEAKMIISEICTVVLPTVFEQFGLRAFRLAGAELLPMLKQAREAAHDTEPPILQTKSVTLSKLEYPT